VPFDAERADAAPGKLGERRKAGDAKAHHDDVVLRHVPEPD
jgi:hypothetical protein